MKDPDHPEASTSLSRFVHKAQRAVGLLGEVNVCITNDSEMRRLNRQFRKKDKSTDVISFPAFQNGKKHLAGDIAISADIARTNAKSLGHSLEDELKILLLHGLLHLAGHDHESDNGEMGRLERKFRAQLGLPTGLIERTAIEKSPQHQKNRGEPAAPGRGFRRAAKIPKIRKNESKPLFSVSSFDANNAPDAASKHTAGGGRFSSMHPRKRYSNRTRAARRLA